MMTVRKFDIEIYVPNGWELVGYKRPRAGEFYIPELGGEPMSAVRDFDFFRMVVRKVKQYREPTLPADYRMQVEFSDDNRKWNPGILGGWLPLDDNDEYVWVNDKAHSYKYCRIEVENE